MNYDENGPDYSLDHDHDEDDRHQEEAAHRTASAIITVPESWGNNASTRWVQRTEKAAAEHRAASDAAPDEEDDEDILASSDLETALKKILK